MTTAGFVLLFCVALIRAEFPWCEDVSAQRALNETDVFTPTTGEQVVSIPYGVFSAFFAQPPLWPSWNHLFSSVETASLKECSPLVATFGILPNVTFPEGTVLSPPVVVVANLTSTSLIYSWTYAFAKKTGESLIVGRHDYVLTRLTETDTMFYSWEKVDGGDFLLENRAEFQNNLQNAQLAAIAGSSCLQKVFWEYGHLDVDVVARVCQNVCTKSVCYGSK